MRCTAKSAARNLLEELLLHRKKVQRRNWITSVMLEYNSPMRIEDRDSILGRPHQQLKHFEVEVLDARGERLVADEARHLCHCVRCVRACVMCVYVCAYL